MCGRSYGTVGLAFYPYLGLDSPYFALAGTMGRSPKSVGVIEGVCCGRPHETGCAGFTVPVESRRIEG